MLAGLTVWAMLVPQSLGYAALAGMPSVNGLYAAVGEFPSGIPIPSLPGVPLSDTLGLLGPAFAVALLVYPDSALTGRSLASINN